MSDDATDPHAGVCDFEWYQEFVDDERVPFVYTPRLGHGVLRIMARSAGGLSKFEEFRPVWFCPWCGRPLR